MARLGRADHRWICPFMGVKRSCRLRARNDVNDPKATWTRQQGPLAGVKSYSSLEAPGMSGLLFGC